MGIDTTRQRGFTLVEVLAAVALSTMLLLVLVTVAASVKRDEHHLAAHADQAARHGRVLSLIRRDLKYARTVVDESDSLIIDGYGALAGDTLAPTHRPAIVTYRLVRAGAGGALIREQDGLTEGETFRELVSLNVAAFDAELVFEERKSSAAAPPAEDEDAGPASAVREDSPFPDAVRLSVHWISGAGDGDHEAGVVMRDEVTLR